MKTKNVHLRGTNPDSPESTAAPRVLKDPGAFTTFRELTRIRTRSSSVASEQSQTHQRSLIQAKGPLDHLKETSHFSTNIPRGHGAKLVQRMTGRSCVPKHLFSTFTWFGFCRHKTVSGIKIKPTASNASLKTQPRTNLKLRPTGQKSVTSRVVPASLKYKLTELQR